MMLNAEEKGGAAGGRTSTMYDEEKKQQEGEVWMLMRLPAASIPSPSAVCHEKLLQRSLSAQEEHQEE